MAAQCHIATKTSFNHQN